MVRTTSFDEYGNKKGEWTADEDQILAAYVFQNGVGDWQSLPKRAGLKRHGKSCRLRWLNYLRPGIKKGKFSPEEDQIIIQLHADIGNRWAAIARHLPNRTDNDVKNHWNSTLKKQLYRAGFDPLTHTPLLSNPIPSSSSSSTSSPSRSNGSGSTHFLNKLAAKISERRGIAQSSLDYVGRLKEIVLEKSGNGSDGVNNEVRCDDVVFLDADEDASFDGGVDARIDDLSCLATWFDQSSDLSSFGVDEAFLFGGYNNA